MTTTTALPDEATVRDALREVIDPEIGENIVDLGLIYQIEIRPEQLLVNMTMTSPACPMGEMITEEVHAVLTGLVPASCQVAIQLVWEPPWEPAMMSDASREHFGW
ncbi:metal-sulfur cluster assembly factor [Leeia oryzae]|uniref:metal-sulfur cluster assembly factor n=1 Tax=Leeia oryzae TaxID=356662 RepID=UPI00037F2E8D|nr:metal-sulfur cluster assembly factor [Leeia oryzae]